MCYDYYYKGDYDVGNEEVNIWVNNDSKNCVDKIYIILKVTVIVNICHLTLASHNQTCTIY